MIDAPPQPDRHQIPRLNRLWDVAAPHPEGGWRGMLQWIAAPLLKVIANRQREFNAAVVDHINRNLPVDGSLAHSADALIRQREALLARERRAEATVSELVRAHDELRAAIGVLQQATQNLKHEMVRLAESDARPPALRAPSSWPPGGDGCVASAATTALAEALDSHRYVGFEDHFRGSPADITKRVAQYVPIFAGVSDVLDIGCGRGEFLELLREHDVRARGIDVNHAMVQVCLDRGLNATEDDALAYLQRQADGSIGGLFAAQVIEHLEPRYLTRLLDTAFDKLRPGAPIVLETINPACWFAFFESYVRDITHVRPIHPDTLNYLLVAAGFQRIEIRYCAPYPDRDKLQQVAQPEPDKPRDGGLAVLAHWAETLNANVEKINALLFTWLDYAAIGRRP
jgi:2-polyprenyl-3-methyl-5-hydroxy-6-metoxy-1,4-benzoquinol methylase